jgi:hypothetical protein
MKFSFISLLARRIEDPCLIPVYSVLDLWCKKRQSVSVFCQYFCFRLSVSFYQCTVFCQYFCFRLSVSFYQCTVFCQYFYFRLSVSFYQCTVFCQYFCFRLSVSFYQCSILIFIYMILLPEGQTGDTWEPSKKQCSFGNRGSFDRKIFFLFHSSQA